MITHEAPADRIRTILEPHFRSKDSGELDAVITDLTRVVFDASEDVALRIARVYQPQVERLAPMDRLRLAALITPSKT